MFELKNVTVRTLASGDGHYQLASQRKKNVRFEWMIFLPYYKNGGKL